MNFAFGRVVASAARQCVIRGSVPSEISSAKYSIECGTPSSTEVNLSEDVTWDVNERKAEPAIPEYIEKSGETEEVLRARLRYQSRKRGTLENGLLLSLFCSRHMPSLTVDQLTMYDRLINKPSNDWDIYHWVTGSKPVPNEFDNDVMSLLKQFAKNSEKELRVTMPDLIES